LRCFSLSPPFNGVVSQKTSVEVSLTCRADTAIEWLLAAANRAPLARWLAFLNSYINLFFDERLSFLDSCILQLGPSILMITE